PAGALTITCTSWSDCSVATPSSAREPDRTTPTTSALPAHRSKRSSSTSPPPTGPSSRRPGQPGHQVVRGGDRRIADEAPAHVPGGPVVPQRPAGEQRYPLGVRLAGDDDRTRRGCLPGRGAQH